MTTPVLLPAVEHDAQPLNPAGGGLYAASTLIDSDGPTRFIGEGVRIRPFNCSDAYGTWPVEPCLIPGDLLKTGERTAVPDPFAPLVVWSYDECDMTAKSAIEITARAAQILRLNEPMLVESHYAERLLLDSGTPDTAANLVAAVGALESALGRLGMFGVIHASRKWAAVAAQNKLLISSGSTYKTPLGHTWVFGGGYDDVLGNTLVATLPVTVWRDTVEIRETIDPSAGLRAAVGERTIVVGHECTASAVTVEP